MTVEKFADSLGEARVSRRGETEIKSKRKRREREREREGFVAGIYFSSSISRLATVYGMATCMYAK